MRESRDKISHISTSDTHKSHISFAHNDSLCPSHFYLVLMHTSKIDSDPLCQALPADSHNPAFFFFFSEEGNILYCLLFQILTLKPQCCFRSGGRRAMERALGRNKRKTVFDRVLAPDSFF